MSDDEIEAGYAAMGQGEAFDHDLMALVIAARAVCNARHFASPAGMAEAFGHLTKALDQFEPWLDADESPEAQGWVGRNGRP